MSIGEQTTIVVPDQLFEQEQSDQLRSSIDHAVLTGATQIELSFENCRATSVYGLNVLIQAQEKLRASGGSLKISGLKPELKEILTNILFDQLIPLS